VGADRQEGDKVPVKTDMVDVNETRKNLLVEIPSEVVDAEIERVARQYSRKARVPGFRPGKAPARVIRQRFRDQILHDVAHDLIPPAIDEALRTRGVEAVDTPDVRDVNVDEGKALTFTASFDTLPPFDPGPHDTLALRRPPSTVEAEAVDQALQRLRERAARFEPVTGRGVAEGDTVTLDITRSQIETSSDGAATTATRLLDKHEDVAVELGAKGNPPGFDAHLLGLEAGAEQTFTIHYPTDYQVSELADTDVSYAIVMKDIRRRVLPDLDDEFAKDLGEFDTLGHLTTRVREDLEREARHGAQRELRAALMTQLAARLSFEVPRSLVEHEIDRRLEEFARRLVEQNVDPRKAGIDWTAFRESQQGAAREAVASSIVLDQVARIEHLEVGEEDVEREIAQYAARVGRTPAAVRAVLEKEGGLSQMHRGLRREKAIDFILARATITEE
jgi:trigger factor